MVSAVRLMNASSTRNDRSLACQPSVERRDEFGGRDARHPDFVTLEHAQTRSRNPGVIVGYGIPATRITHPPAEEVAGLVRVMSAR